MRCVEDPKEGKEKNQTSIIHEGEAKGLRQKCNRGRGEEVRGRGQKKSLTPRSGVQRR